MLRIRPVLIERTPSRIDAIRVVSPSARVVYAALAGDLAVAAAKFGASALSGSTAMLTEAIHSLVDSADQILLLLVSPVPANPLTEPIRWGMAWKRISGPSSLPYSSFS